MNILVMRDGQQFGPYSEQEVREYFAAGRLSPGDMAWCEGQPAWVPLSQLVALSSMPAPPPLPPSQPVRPPSIYEKAPAAPAPTVGTSPEDDAIYDPKTSAYCGLLFSPAFSAFLHARNWRRLGNVSRARASWAWFYGTLVFICSAPFLPDLPGSTSPNYVVGTLVFLCWYYGLGKKQIDYVKDAYPHGYPKRSMQAPVLTACGALFAFVLVIVAVFALASRRTPEQIARSMAEEVRPQILKTWSTRPQLVNPSIKQITLTPVNGSRSNFTGTVDATLNGENVRYRLVISDYAADGTYKWQLLEK